MDKATIRPVEARDEAAIARLWQMLSDYHVTLDERLPTPTAGAAQRYAARLVERRDDPYTRALVAEVNGSVVGYVLGAVIDLQPDLFAHVDAGFIADIFVESAQRRRGIARQLVAVLNEWFATRDVRHVELQVATANHPAREFWESVRARAVTVRMQIPLDRREGEQE